MSSALDDIKGTREPVQWFARQMELKLRENDHKGGWSQCSTWWLLSRLREEVNELEQTMYAAAAGDVCVDHVVSEAADVANFAMMIADIARGMERSV
jgi:hypothetical protein